MGNLPIKEREPPNKLPLPPGERVGVRGIWCNAHVELTGTCILVQRGGDRKTGQGNLQRA